MVRSEYKKPLLVWLALMGLLALTLGSAYLKLGAWNNVANLGIAIVKAALVLLVFMKLNSSSGAIRIYAGVGLFTLAVLFLISGSDYATRTLHRAPWQVPAATPEK